MNSIALRHGVSNREWFIDPRAPDRRLQVTGHPDAGRVVLSTWNGSTCTATFQLPLEDTPHLIAHLADCLTVGIERQPENTMFTQPWVSGVQRARAAIKRMSSRFRR